MLSRSRQTWPQFKATTSTPVFSLYDALGRPDNLTVRGMFRARGEGLANQFRPAPFARDDYMASFFTDIFAEYNLGTVKIGAELFDSRGYGEPRNSAVSTNEVNALELGQAYLNVDLSDAVQDGSRSSLTAGRFTKDIGSRRLVARNVMRNTINSFTGLSYDWKGANKDQMTLLWTMPQTRLPDDTRGIRNNTIEFDSESPDLQLFGGSYTFAKVLGGTFEVYGYGLYEQDTGTTGAGSVQTRNRRLFTPGARLARAKKARAVGLRFRGDLPDGSRPGDGRHHRHPRPQGLGLLRPWRGGLHLRCALAATGRAAIRSRQRRQQQP